MSWSLAMDLTFAFLGISVRTVGIPISMGMMASIPYLMANGDTLVDFRLVVFVTPESRSDPIGRSEPNSGARYYLYYILGLSLTCSFSELYLYLWVYK